MNDWCIENIVTIIGTVVLILGLFVMSGSFHAYWGALLLLNINIPKKC